MNHFNPDKYERDRKLAAVESDRPKADFSDLVGRWTPDPAFDEIIASQRKIDAAKWR